MSIELHYDISKKTEVSLVKVYCKREPIDWDGSLYDVRLEVGRDASCDIAIQYDGDESTLYKLISKKHAEIRLSSSGVFVKDSNSKNGTFLGNMRLTPDVWTVVKDRNCVSLGCPFEISHGGKWFKNPYAIRFDKIQHLMKVMSQRSEDRKLALGRSDQPRSWQAIKKSFNAMPGSKNIARSPTMQSPVKKKSKENNIIDLTQGEEESGLDHGTKPSEGPTQGRVMPPVETLKTEPRPSPTTTAAGRNSYDPNMMYYLERDVQIRLPTGPSRAMKFKHIRRVPGEFLSDPVHGKRAMDLFDLKPRGRRVTLLALPPRTSASTRGIFFKEFSQWMTKEYAPKAHARINALAAKLPDKLMCHCLPGQQTRHMLLPGYRLECGHSVCGLCLQCSVEMASVTPCCSRDIQKVPPELDTNKALQEHLEDANLHVEYGAVYGDPKRRVEKLRRIIQSKTQYNNVQYPIRDSLASGADVNVEKQNLLPKPTFIVSDKPSTQSCKQCQKAFSPEDSNLVFGIRQDTVCSWYHMPCVDPGIRFRALTEGIQDYSNMDETKKTQILREILATS